MSKTRVSFKKKMITDLADLLSKVAVLETLLQQGETDVDVVLEKLKELKTKIVELLAR